MHRLALLIPILFAGCLDIEEEITVRPDGSADVRLIYRGDPGDFAPYLLVPGEGWKSEKRVEVEKTDKGPKDKWVWEFSRTFRDLNEYPASFGPSALPNRDRYLRHETRLKITNRGAYRVYEFEREYPQMDVRDIDAVDERLAADPRLKALIDKLGHDGVKGLSREERILLFETAVNAEREKQMLVAERAVAQFSRLHGLRSEDRRAILARMEAVLREALTGEGLRRRTEHYLANADREPFNFDFLRAVQKEAVAAGDKVAAVANPPSFRAVHEAEETAAGAGKAVGDDFFKVTVRLPGEGPVEWKFDGRELYNRGMVLRAVAVEKIR